MEYTGGLDRPNLEFLLQQTAGGDKAAYRALFDEMAPVVIGLVRRVLKDPAMSEEVAQDVLLEVWRQAPRFDPGKGKASTWIITIAHRRAVDRVRSEQAARDRADRYATADVATPFDEVGEEIVEASERSRVRKAMDRLTDLQRQAIEMAYFDGLTYREVGERLDVPLPTIKTRMRDGLKALRTAFEETS